MTGSTPGTRDRTADRTRHGAGGYVLDRDSPVRWASVGSSARVIGFVNGLQAFLVNVSVDLRSGDICMSKKLLDNSQVGSILQ